MVVPQAVDTSPRTRGGRRAHVQLVVVLLVLMATVDDRGRPSLMAPARAAGALVASVVPLLEERAAKTESPADRASVESAPLMARLAAPFRKLIGGWGMIYMPAGFSMAADGAYDLLVHFHGGAPLVEQELDESDLNAVLVTVNLGIGSSVYKDHFADPTRFDRMLASIDEMVRAHGPSGRATLRRLALGNWSAGFGAIGAILASDANRARVDTLLIADGLHGMFAEPRGRRIYEPGLAPYVAFAREAARGDKLMVVTHSAIGTLEYASTTETARYLVDALELPEAPLGASPDGLRGRSSHAAGGMQVHGFEGDDAKAHCQHLWRFSETMLGPLARRWASRG